MSRILGHHHTSMITKNAKKNNKFYQEVLGLRRVKATVNQDDPSMYHLFYGDRTGSPGTELTFFEMPKVGQTYHGTNAITQIGLLIPSEESLYFWKDRFKTLHVSHEKLTTFENRQALPFQDPDGLRLMLIVEKSKRLPHWEAWENSNIPKRHQILGMGPVVLKVRRLSKLVNTLTEIFKYTIVEKSKERFILQPKKGNVFGEIIALKQEGERERPGRGSIHHLALRVKNDSDLYHLKKQIKARGFATTEVIDRYYFKSLYFRESNGIMFEIATDGPGFTVDASVDTLGTTLDLPPFLEKRREEIEAQLTPLEEL